MWPPPIHQQIAALSETLKNPYGAPNQKEQAIAYLDAQTRARAMAEIQQRDKLRQIARDLYRVTDTYSIK